MDLFTLRANIGRFRDLLATDLDADMRKRVEKLLAEYEAKLGRFSSEPTTLQEAIPDG